VVKKHRGQAPVIGFPAQPEGLQESSRWSESAESTGKVVRHDRTQKECQTSEQVVLVKFDTRRVAKISIQVHPKDRYIESSGTPPGCDPIKDPIPGGLRGLRPPATFFATLRVALR